MGKPWGNHGETMGKAAKNTALQEDLKHRSTAFNIFFRCFTSFRRKTFETSFNCNAPVRPLPAPAWRHSAPKPSTSRHKGIASAKGNESGKKLGIDGINVLLTGRAIFNPCLFMLIHHPRHQQQLVLPRRPGPRRTIGFPFYIYVFGQKLCEKKHLQ